MTGSIRLGNKRAASQAKPVEGDISIDIDRSNPVLGNRHILSDHRSRNARIRCIEAFRMDMEEDGRRNGPMTKATKEIARLVLEGKSVILNCWCYPKPCHGDVIKWKVLESIRKIAPEYRVLTTSDSGIAENMSFCFVDAGPAK